MYDDDSDPNAVFFGTPDSSPDLPFPMDDEADIDSDPADDGPVDGATWLSDDGDIDHDQLGRIGYDRSDTGIFTAPGDDIRDTVPGSGRELPDRIEQQRSLEREAAATGDRHVGRVADLRSGSDPAGASGGSGSAAERVADSIRLAQQRLRSDRTVDSTVRVGTPERAAIPDGAIVNGSTLRSLEQVVIPDESTPIKRHYERTTLSAPPSFHSTTFESTIIGLKANTTGDWIISFKVSPEHKAAVMDLAGAYGLALIMHVERRKRGSNE